ncbi:MAG: hypothetical protein MUO63_01755, partial [Desulfobulbaceae bacterium]|nr:hypothetical protein [Desulfobulbaceae bacterium]
GGPEGYGIGTELKLFLSTLPRHPCKRRAKQKFKMWHKKNDIFIDNDRYLTPDNTIKFVGCPLIEFGALEPNSGDVYFIEIIDEKAQQLH